MWSCISVQEGTLGHLLAELMTSGNCSILTGMPLRTYLQLSFVLGTILQLSFLLGTPCKAATAVGIVIRALPRLSLFNLRLQQSRISLLHR